MLHIFILTALAALSLGQPPHETSSMHVYFGTGNRANAIYVSNYNPDTGALSEPEVAAELARPTFLALGPNKERLYAVCKREGNGDDAGGGVAAFKIEDDSGKLLPLGQRSSGGQGPCHVSVSADGEHVFVANYSSGSVAVLTVNFDGSLTPPTIVVQYKGSSVNPRRQKGPHAHQFVPGPGKDPLLWAVDLGTDQVISYRFDGKSLTRVSITDTQPGAGPRHIAFTDDGRFAYVINEMGNTIAAYRNDNGKLDPVQTVATLPDDFDGENTTAEIAVHPSGRWLYGSNRGEDTIVAYAIDPDTGRLSLLDRYSAGGKNPRYFGLDPAGRFMLVANQDSDNIVVLAIDPDTGKLRDTGQTIAVPNPMCAVFVTAVAEK